MAVFYTLGHGTRSYADLLALLDANHISFLADIRSFPRSQTNPQFNHDRLAATLPDRGITYHHMEPLGGYREQSATSSLTDGWRNASFQAYAEYALTDPFQAALDELIDAATEHTVGYMCAEAVYWRCHRRIVSDWLVARGHDVIHMYDEERADEHTLTPFAIIEDGEVIYPEE